MLVVYFAVGTFLCERPSIREASRKTTLHIEDEHLFTPQEASRLLPDIKPKVKELVERKKAMAQLHSEIEKYSLLGFKSPEVAEKAAQLDAMVEGMTKKLAELEDLGVSVKDLDFGLVDFPAERYGEKVLLCWRYGEPDVSYWHKPNEGYNGRKSLKIQLIQP